MVEIAFNWRALSKISGVNLTPAPIKPSASLISWIKASILFASTLSKHTRLK